MWHGVTQAQEDRVGRVITLGWLRQLSGLESRHNVPEKGNRKCCVYSVPGQHTSAYCYPGFALHAAGLVYIPNLFPCNINNQYLGLNAVFCTCQVPLSRVYNPQLQGQLTKAVLKKACQSTGLIWLAVVFAELLGFFWRGRLFFPLSWFFIQQSELPVVVAHRGHV